MNILARLFGSARKEPISDIGKVDLFLQKWDQFAVGSPDSSYHLGGRYPEFESSLLRLFAEGDQRAVSRFIFYQLVQVGGFIDAEGTLGRAFTNATQGSCVVTNEAKSTPQYFAGTLYFWWLEHSGEYPHLPLMDDWLQRDFARRTAIPLYSSMRSQ